MADPITTVITVVSEHPQSAAALASVYGVVKPFLARILGPGADELGEIGRDFIKGKRAKNADRTLADADKLLADVGREAQPVPLTTLVPLLEAASLQEESSLAAKWAALLANVADPQKKQEITPGFADILRQLTPHHAGLLDKLFDIASHTQRRYPEEVQPREELDRERTVHSTVDLGTIYSRTTTSESHKTEAEDNEAQHQFEATIDNFLRLGLLVLAVMPPEKPSSMFFPVLKPKRKAVFFTSLGYDFMRACMPPE